MKSIFKEMLEQIINQVDILSEEFANVDPRCHKWGVNVKFHILQMEDQRLKHGARIKVFKESWSKGDNFTITISDTPIVIGNWKSIVTTKELNILKKCVKIYKIPLLNFWHDSGKTPDELRDQMDIIDAGGVVEKEYV